MTDLDPEEKTQKDSKLVNWASDPWFVIHYYRLLTEDFKKWWIDFYGSPDQFNYDLSESHEYWIRCGFALAGWIGRGESISDQPKPIGEPCEICDKFVEGFEYQGCCDGRECGCMGMPIEPCVCSEECWDKLMERYKKEQS